MISRMKLYLPIFLLVLIPLGLHVEGHTVWYQDGNFVQLETYILTDSRTVWFHYYIDDSLVDEIKHFNPFEPGQLFSIEDLRSYNLSFGHHTVKVVVRTDSAEGYSDQRDFQIGHEVYLPIIIK